MKQLLKTIWLAALLFATAFSGRGQGFINFDFEQSIVTNDSWGQVISLVPGWNGYIFGNSLEYFAVNAVSLGGAVVSLDQTNYVNGASIEGRYYIGLTAQRYYNYYGDPPPFSNNVAIAQTGLIPSSAKSILFSGNMGTMRVSFNNFLLAFSTLSSTANYSVYAADISSFAGQIGELRFEATTKLQVPFFGYWAGGGEIDNIQFSSTAVPEPSTLALFGFGAVMLGVRRLCSRD